MVVKFIIKKGKELTDEELNVLNEWRVKEFHSKNLIKPVIGDDNWEKIYFLLLDKNNKALAFCRIHEVNIEFMDKEYRILGLATLISTIRGKGYGKRLASEMIKYVQDSGKTGIGFCNKILTDYYRGIGFGIIEEGAQRFVYKNEKGKLLTNPWRGGDVIFIAGDDGLIKEILNRPGEKVITDRLHW
jgi:predicted GNAT family N-acyltransferase